MSQIRIGRIKYTNVWPVFHHFSIPGADASIEWVSETPAGVNRAMAEGRIDLAPVSSFAYAVHSDDYLILPDLSVSAYGDVKSIFVFHREPLENLRHARIALPTTSATSINLLKIIMRNMFGGAPSYTSEPPDLEHMMATSDAALLIGDDAIRASWHNRLTNRYRMTDLGQLWNRMTGHWMTYAVWVVRKQAASRMPEWIDRIHDAFCRSKEQSMSDLSAVAQHACRRIGGERSYWIDYFSNLSYDFGTLQKEGLSLYYQYAYEAGLLKQKVQLNMWRGEESPICR